MTGTTSIVIKVPHCVILLINSPSVLPPRNATSDGTTLGDDRQRPRRTPDMGAVAE